MTTAVQSLPATTTSTPARAAAIGARGFAAGVAVQNFVLLIGMPDASATMQEAAAWLADNPGRAATASATPVFTALWSLHNAAFATSFSALGVALLGFSIGAHAAGISPTWQRSMGLLAAVLLLVAGFANAAVAEGSPIVFVGLLGFALWLVWLVTTGLRLLR